MAKRIILLLILCNQVGLIGQNRTELIIKNRIDHLESLAREPMIAEHPNGSLFLTGFKNDADVPQLWRSTDQGKNWQAVDVGTYEMGAQGNSDVDIFIDGEGTIYFLNMTFSKLMGDNKSSEGDTPKGKQINLGISRDGGHTWKWQAISKNDYDDRPWITASTNGDLHIIWNDGKGVHHTISKDKGETWMLRPKIHHKGGSSFLAHGSRNQLVVRVTPLSASGNIFHKGTDLAKISLDNGLTWKDIQLPGTRNWAVEENMVPRWVEPMAFDERGNLYTLWSEGTVLKLGISADHGENWREEIIYKGGHMAYFPYLEPMGNTLLCTWVSGFEEDLRHHAAALSLSETEVFAHELQPQQLDIWSRFVTEDYQRTNGGEYFPIIPLSNGNIGMATPVQNKKGKRLGFTWWELELNEF